MTHYNGNVLKLVDLKHVVFWRLSFDECRDIFLFTDANLQKSIPGCSDGPAFFSAVLTKAEESVASKLRCEEMEFLFTRQVINSVARQLL